jgi:hypothetical protein
MKLTHLNDQALITQTKELVHTERSTLTKILHYLREIERRKLYCDFGCSSLFDYAVKCLNYSEGQAGRRIQAMRLMKEIPEIEEKIETGVLSLSNIAQAQSYFRDARLNEHKILHGAQDNGRASITQGGSGGLSRDRKLEVLKLLENKSSRDGQRELINMGGAVAAPKERERPLTDDTSEIRFVMDKDLKQKLEEARALLGNEGAALSFADLVAKITELGIESLKSKNFGQRRSQIKNPSPAPSQVPAPRKTPTPTTPAPEENSVSRSPRYIPRAVKHQVWQRDAGTCRGCGSRRGLQYDHIVPVVRGGVSTPGNLRLLCFACNQRAGIRAGVVPLGS